MDHKNREENGMRTRSFRKEDYNNRRAFLRSYPLQWEADDTSNEESSKVTRENSLKKPIKKTFQWEGEDNTANEAIKRVTRENSQKRRIKKIIISTIHWGEGKVMIFRKFKDKFIVYIIACFSTGLQPRTPLISV